MCDECWDERGRPAEWNPNIDRARGLIEAICMECSTCAPLHMVVENWNLDDASVRWTLGELPGMHDWFRPEVLDTAKEVLTLFAQMTVAERASTLAYVDGHAELPGDAWTGWQDIVYGWWRAEGKY